MSSSWSRSAITGTLPAFSVSPGGAFPGCLGTPYDGDHLVGCPLFDEVVVSRHSQRDAYGALRPIDRADNLCLDFPALLGKVREDNIADLQPLHLELDRHQPMLRLACR